MSPYLATGVSRSRPQARACVPRSPPTRAPARDGTTRPGQEPGRSQLSHLRLLDGLVEFLGRRVIDQCACGRELTEQRQPDLDLGLLGRMRSRNHARWDAVEHRRADEQLLDASARDEPLHVDERVVPVVTPPAVDLDPAVVELGGRGDRGPVPPVVLDCHEQRATVTERS